MEPTTIDLSSALRLAGVQNLQIVVAQQRVEAAVAGQQLAAAQILPDLNLGTNFDSHTGVLQQPTGEILAVNRSALYVGAGAYAVGSGTVQIPGLQYNINISRGDLQLPGQPANHESIAIRPASRRQRRAARRGGGLRGIAPRRRSAEPGNSHAE